MSAVHELFVVRSVYFREEETKQTDCVSSRATEETATVSPSRRVLHDLAVAISFLLGCALAERVPENKESFGTSCRGTISENVPPKW